eukprot:scaffold90054_cov75-Phaeocystis_antarctica.AAC.10
MGARCTRFPPTRAMGGSEWWCATPLQKAFLSSDTSMANAKRLEALSAALATCRCTAARIRARRCSPPLRNARASPRWATLTCAAESTLRATIAHDNLMVE